MIIEEKHCLYCNTKIVDEKLTNCAKCSAPVGIVELIFKDVYQNADFIVFVGLGLFDYATFYLYNKGKPVKAFRLKNSEIILHRDYAGWLEKMIIGTFDINPKSFTNGFLVRDETGLQCDRWILKND